MIRSEAEYQEARRRLEADKKIARQQELALAAKGMSPEDVEYAMQPLLSFQAQLAEEVRWYEDVSRGNLPKVRRLTDMGRLLIALRIYKGLTQKELADRLGIAPAIVSRDERNEYHGITVERAQRILDALDASVITMVEEEARPLYPEPNKDLVPV